MQSSRRLAVFLRPYRVWAVLAPLLMALEVAMDLLQPRLVQQIIDDGVARGDMGVVLSTGGLMLVVALIGVAGGVGCGVFAVLAGQGFGADLRAALFGKVQSLSFGNLDRLETGGLITRLTNDVTQMQELVMMLLRIMVRVPLLLVGSLIMAVLTSPLLALIFLVLIPLVLAALVWIIRKTFPIYSEVQRRLDTLNTVMQENLAGMRLVKAFARAGHEIARFARANTRLMEQNIAAVRIGAASMPLMMLFLNIGIVGAVWFGGLQVNIGGLQTGQLIAFINYLMQTLMSLMMISMLVMRLARAEASADRIHEVLDARPDVPPAADGIRVLSRRGRVVFEEVSFAYTTSVVKSSMLNGEDTAAMPVKSSMLNSEGTAANPAHIDEQPSTFNLQPSTTNDLVLKNISFTAEPGSTVAILGATGAGKSSLINLIPRFYDVSAGRITVDGIDVRRIDEASLRSAIGIALQESVLFSGTIRDNIRYGKPDASEEEVIAAAQMAQAHEFISRFPQGYDSIVGQRGVNLSGGQKQRIAIARALLTRPSILILDDSTSAVDVTTESHIQRALAELPERPTRIVVAQRISTVLGADTILVLDDGQVAAQGSHAELLATSPIYREIYESQVEHGAITNE